MIGLSPRERKSKKRREKSALKVTKGPFGSSTLFLRRLLRMRGATTAPISSVSKRPVRSLLLKRRGTSTPPSLILIQSLSRLTLGVIRSKIYSSTEEAPATYSLGIPSSKWEFHILL